MSSCTFVVVPHRLCAPRHLLWTFLTRLLYSRTVHHFADCPWGRSWPFLTCNRNQRRHHHKVAITEHTHFLLAHFPSTWPLHDFTPRKPCRCKVPNALSCRVHCCLSLQTTRILIRTSYAGTRRRGTECTTARMQILSGSRRWRMILRQMNHMPLLVCYSPPLNFFSFFLKQKNEREIYGFKVHG